MWTFNCFFCVLQYTACIFSQHYVFGFSHFCPATILSSSWSSNCGLFSSFWLFPFGIKLLIKVVYSTHSNITVPHSQFLLVALFQRLANDPLHIIFWWVTSPSPKPCLYSEAGEWDTLIGLSPSQLTPAFGVGDKFHSNYMAKNGIGEVF